ncbi:MAG: TetR/AcrR family transcriptional regulator [Nocardioides sp.]|nr:TetR/AcrR family transcriptional regulator [Nocardioides sp.]
MSTQQAGRQGRRKAATRAALVAAATNQLAEGRPHASIQEITEAADVGFGSFYNHFSSKEELFDAAVSETLDAHAQVLARAAQGIDDLAERLAVGVRASGRLQRQLPEMSKVILHHGTTVLTREHGLVARAREDLSAGVVTGRFVSADPGLSFMLAGGALLGLLQWLEDNPEADAGLATDQLVENLLTMLGLPPSEARALATSHLPASLGA